MKLLSFVLIIIFMYVCEESNYKKIFYVLLDFKKRNFIVFVGIYNVFIYCNNV